MEEIEVFFDSGSDSDSDSDNINKRSSSNNNNNRNKKSFRSIINDRRKVLERDIALVRQIGMLKQNSKKNGVENCVANGGILYGGILYGGGCERNKSRNADSGRSVKGNIVEYNRDEIVLNVRDVKDTKDVRGARDVKDYLSNGEEESFEVIRRKGMSKDTAKEREEWRGGRDSGDETVLEKWRSEM
jgi:hypothetical protein